MSYMFIILGVTKVISYVQVERPANEIHRPNN
jgi:hypothetical protein